MSPHLLLLLVLNENERARLNERCRLNDLDMLRELPGRDQRWLMRDEYELSIVLLMRDEYELSRVLRDELSRVLRDELSSLLPSALTLAVQSAVSSSVMLLVSPIEISECLISSMGGGFADIRCNLGLQRVIDGPDSMSSAFCRNSAENSSQLLSVADSKSTQTDSSSLNGSPWLS